MAALDENTLKPEEEIGGFDPGAPGDETFFIESQDAYPGTMPDFSVFEEESHVSDVETDDEQPEPEIEEVAETPVEEVVEEGSDDEVVDTADMDEGSVWDLFEENEGEEEAPDEEDVSEDDADLNQDNADDALLAGLTPDEEEEPEVEPEVETPVEPDILDAAPVAAMDEEEEIPADPGSFAMDDDLRKMLEDEIDRGKDSRETDETPDSVLEDDSNFDSVNDLDDASEIDLSNIDAEHPSNFGLNADGEKEPEKTDEKPKKKDKKKSPLKKIIIISSVAMVLIVFAIAGYSYRNKISGMFGGGSDSTQVDTSAVAEIVTEEVVVDTAVVPEVIPEEIPDTTLVPEADSAITELAVADTVVPEPEVPIEEESIAVAEPIKPKVEPTKPKVDHKPIASKPKNKKKHFPSKTSRRAWNITSKKYDIPKETTEDRLYTVQVYASPSKDDAETWLARLKKKNARNAFITTKRIRDEIVYRVRFGAFKTKADARKAAVKLGFDQSWIDRVR